MTSFDAYFFDREKIDMLFDWLEQCPFPYKYRYDMDGKVTITLYNDKDKKND
tara:strand:+ start:309 stop:464 length:156 start_codon:yes stop_codon:yes gene_type:complete